MATLPLDENSENVNPPPLRRSTRSKSSGESVKLSLPIVLISPVPSKRKRTSSNTPKTPSIYQEARSIFRRTSAPTFLVGRDLERTRLRQFWDDHVFARKPGALYISGAPGTGKTALVNETLRALRSTVSKSRTTIISVNCMSISGTSGIYDKLLTEAGFKRQGSAQISKCALQEAFFKKGESKIYLVILDEIDNLLSRSQEVLYTLFQWPTLPNARLVLVGIANALDLTDRFLPRLRAANIEPELIHFYPYNIAEISAIIKQRLHSLCKSSTSTTHTPSGQNKDPFATYPEDALKTTPLMEEKAIMLCARKVAATSGDLRKALDVCRQAIEIVDAETRRAAAKQPFDRSVLIEKETHQNTVVLSTRDGNSPAVSLTRNPPFLTSETAPKVTLAHIHRIFSAISGSQHRLKILQLPLQQKLLLSVLALNLHRLRHPIPPTTAGTPITVATLYRSYLTDCAALLHTVSSSEYQDLLSCLEVEGLVSYTKQPRAGSTAKSSATDKLVELSVPEPEVIAAIEADTNALLKTVLSDAIRKHDRAVQHATVLEGAAKTFDEDRSAG